MSSRDTDSRRDPLTRATASAQPSAPSIGAMELWRGFRSEKSDPQRFYTDLAQRTLEDLSYPLPGRRVLDLGCGPGWFLDALGQRGAEAIGVDLDGNDVRLAAERGFTAVHGDGRRLPFPDDTFDGLLCSNLLEHTPDPVPILSEAARVVRPGGWVWMSWTVWYSPWGGHAIAPFHYLGPHVGLRTKRRLMGPITGKNLPFERLWPTHVGQVLRAVRNEPGLKLVDAHPRYWPSQRWILGVPGVREFLTWNCVLHMRVRDRPSGRPARAAEGDG